MKKTLFLTLYLAILTLIAGAVLYSVQLATMPRILEIAKTQKKEALSIVMPKANYFESTDENLAFENQTTYKALNARKKLTGYVFSAAPKGYGGNIEMLVGISNKKITGVKILQHTETPGLGALAEDPKPLSGQSRSFLSQFMSKSIFDQFNAKSDIISLTGATITSQAIANGVKDSIEVYKRITK